MLFDFSEGQRNCLKCYELISRILMILVCLVGTFIFYLTANLISGDPQDCGQNTFSKILLGFAGVLVVVFIVEMYYTCEYSSRMRTIDSKASKGEINADQLEVSRAQAT